MQRIDWEQSRERMWLSFLVAEIELGLGGCMKWLLGNDHEITSASCFIDSKAFLHSSHQIVTIILGLGILHPLSDQEVKFLTLDPTSQELWVHIHYCLPLATPISNIKKFSKSASECPQNIEKRKWRKGRGELHATWLAPRLPEWLLWEKSSCLLTRYLQTTLPCSWTWSLFFRGFFFFLSDQFLLQFSSTKRVSHLEKC